MTEELEQVVLTVVLPEHCLKAGDVGTVVLVHGQRGYEVEFVSLDGATVAVVSLESGQVRRAAPRENPHARPVEAA
jgi:hypothetical protein